MSIALNDFKRTCRKTNIIVLTLVVTFPYFLPSVRASKWLHLPDTESAADHTAITVQVCNTSEQREKFCSSKLL